MSINKQATKHSHYDSVCRRNARAKLSRGKIINTLPNRDAKPATVFPGHCFPPSLFLNPNSLSLSVSQDSIRFLSSLYGPTHLFNIFLFVFSREKFLSPPKTPTTPSAPLSLSLSLNGFNLNWNSLIDAHFSLSLSPFLPCINYITQYTTSPPPHHCTFLQYTSLSFSLSLRVFVFVFAMSFWVFQVRSSLSLSLSVFCCCFDSVLKFSCDFGISFPCFREFAEYSRSVLRVKALTLNALARDSRFLL